MTRIAINLEPYEGGSNLIYISGKLNVILSLDKSLTISKDYSFSFYTDDLCTLYYANNDYKQVERRGHNFKVTFSDNQIWLPGEYFLLFRSGDIILRFDFQYDEQGMFSETGFRQCLKLSVEDILSGILAPRRQWRVYFSSTPGGEQLKRWVISRLQERAFNAIRSEYHYSSLDYCNSLLIATPSTEYVSRSLLLMRNFAEVKVPNTSVDCNRLFDCTSNDPCDKIDELFHEEETEILPDVSIPSLKEHIYSFSHIGVLLEPGREAVIRRILAHCPSYYHPVVICGTQEEIDHLLELAPSLQGEFPQCNRLVVKPYTPNEMIRGFFHEIDLVNLTLSPETVDAACRIFYERHQHGTIINWTLKDIRQYVRCHILPSYRHRAIDAIQQGIAPTEVINVQPEDLMDNKQVTM